MSRARATIDKVKYHMDHIAELFNTPLVTLIVRAPNLDKGNGEGDFVLTTDDISLVIRACEHRQHAEIMNDIRERQVFTGKETN